MESIKLQKKFFYFIPKSTVDWVLRKDIQFLIIIQQTCEGGECDECHNKYVAQLY